MDRIVLRLGTALVVVALLTACGGAPGTGPMTWLDRPLDAQEFPVAALIVQAHASDEDGVAAIEFYNADQLIGKSPAGGTKLEQASLEWLPPGPGKYIISARAVDNYGNYGAPTHAEINVGGPSAYPPPYIAVAVTPHAAATSTRAPTRAPVAAQPAGPSIELRQNANCREGPGTAYEVNDTLYAGEVYALEGRNDANNWFWVMKRSSSGHCWVSVVSVEIAGELDDVPVVQVAALPAPPPQEQPQEPPEVADVTGPYLDGMGVDPDTIITAGSDCPNYSKTTTVMACAEDISGVASVTARILGMGQIAMEDYDHNGCWAATLGPFEEDGEYTVVFEAIDNQGNQSSTGYTLLYVQGCIG